jgi:2,3-diketo-5-methylthio-1-phosphopentane phosphatase
MLKFFIDFDGTITKQDVGDALFEKFGGEQCKEFIREYHEEKISAVQCFEKETAACGIVNKFALDSFLDAQEIDSTFPDFIQYCRANEFQAYILSDGLDYYIHRILSRFGVGDVPVYSNTLHLEPVIKTSASQPHTREQALRREGEDKELSKIETSSAHVRFVPSFPYTDEVCNRCASCKRNHMLSLSGDDDIILYIGEGYSDRCPVNYADVVFAKDDLLKYCRREEIPHVAYTTFADIVKYIEKMIHKNGRTNIRLKKRRRAELARREAYMGG